MGEEKKNFDLEVVLEGLKGCGQLDGTILLGGYLHAYRELCRFFKLMGKMFGFVATDLESKINILQKHRDSPVGGHYLSVQSMIEYEVKNNLTTSKNHSPSGSRTLLRLHRALEFIIGFMQKIFEGSDADKTSDIAVEVYEQTLAKYHIWLVRKMAGVAMYTLPRRNALIEMMCKHDQERVLQLLQEVVDKGQPIYDIIQRVYAENDLLDLP